MTLFFESIKYDAVQLFRILYLWHT